MDVKNILRKMLYKSEFGTRIWYFLHSANIMLLKIYSDEKYFKRAYRRSSGNELDFENPQTFDEKQLWLKMYYRNPLCTICSDKYLVREYVKEKGLEHILNPLYAVYESVDDIEWKKLPNQFYIKANHMSACNVRCNDLSTFDKKKAIKILKRGLKHNYYNDSREWNYKDIKRRIIVEAIIEDKNKKPLIDYRFLCYRGQCEYIFIDIGTADESGNHLHDAKRNVYDRNMNFLNVTVSRENFEEKLVERPKNFDQMIQYAEKLSGEFPFCRVDLYNVDGNIIFGEITFFHAGGLSRIEPKEWQYKLGENISIEAAKAEMRKRMLQ